MPNSPYASVALIAVLVLLMYFVILRPQKKRQQQQAKTLNAIEPGTRVMLTSGIFATVLAVGEKQMVVETSPGVQLTILKQAMSRAVPAGDEDDPSVLAGGANSTESGFDDSYDGSDDRSYDNSYGNDRGNDAGFGADGSHTEPVWPPSAPSSTDPQSQGQPDMWSAGAESHDQAADGSSSLGQSSLNSNAFDRPDSSTEQSSQSGQPNKE